MSDIGCIAISNIDAEIIYKKYGLVLKGGPTNIFINPLFCHQTI